MSGKDRSFSELYNVFLAHQQAKGQDDFTAACLTWLQFEHSQVKIRFYNGVTFFLKESLFLFLH